MPSNDIRASANWPTRRRQKEHCWERLILGRSSCAGSCTFIKLILYACNYCHQKKKKKSMWPIRSGLSELSLVKTFLKQSPCSVFETWPISGRSRCKSGPSLSWASFSQLLSGVRASLGHRYVSALHLPCTPCSVGAGNPSLAVSVSFGSSSASWSWQRAAVTPPAFNVTDAARISQLVFRGRADVISYW